jgi:hypothetical protein
MTKSPTPLTSDQHRWSEEFLSMLIQPFGDAVAAVGVALFGGDANQPQGGAPDKHKPHVTVISEPIVVHGKDPPIEIKKPVKIVIDKKAKEQSAKIDATRVAVDAKSTEYIIMLHGDMRSRVGKWFREESVKTIDQMPDGPDDLTAGMASAFSSGITAVIGGAFPEVAVAMAVLGGLASAAQTEITSDAKDAAVEMKKQAKEFQIKIAETAETAIDKGRDQAVATVSELLDALENDPEDLQRLLDLTNENVEYLARHRIANRWGTWSDPQILNKLEAKLHLVLQLSIKSVAKNKKRKELEGQVRNRYKSMTEAGAANELAAWEGEYDMNHGIPLPELPVIDVTRPDPPRRHSSH